MNYQVELDVFQGPLELLYQLVKKDKIEISEISLAKVTNQYLEYIDTMQNFDLDLASEFMVIAAELIEIKVRTLLPQNKEKKEETEKTEKSLVERLQEYHVFKQVSKTLASYKKNGEGAFIQLVIEDEQEKTEDLDLKLELTDLIKAYQEVLASKEELTETEKHQGQIIPEKINIQDKINELIHKLRKSPQGLSFQELITNVQNKMEIVVSFLSVLELAKLGDLSLKQDKLFADITLIGNR